MRFGMISLLRLQTRLLYHFLKKGQQRGEHLYWESDDAVSKIQWTHLGMGGPYRCRAVAGRGKSESEKRSKGVGVTHKSDTTQGLIGIRKS